MRSRLKSQLLLFTFATLALLTFLLEEGCRKDPNMEPCNAPAAKPYTLVKPFRFPDMTIPADNALTEEGVDLGHYLFFDSTLSFNHSISCGSCHRPEYGFADSGKVFSLNAKSLPTKRNTPALLNSGYQNKFFYDGRQLTLEDAIDDAIVHEMFVDWDASINYLSASSFYTKKFIAAYGCDSAINKKNIIKSMAQFIRTIISSGSSEIDTKLIIPNNPSMLSAAEYNGYQLFVSARGDCFHCHFTSPLTSDNLFHNSGLEDSDTSFFGFEDLGRGGFTKDSIDNGKFKTPTLRNITMTGPYMHDGRFQTLKEVIDFYSDSVKWSPTLDPKMIHAGNIRLHLTSPEKADLLAFINTMADRDISVNPQYTNPFYKPQ